MRDPLQITRERSAILRQAAVRFPGLDPAAIELQVALEHVAEVAKKSGFSPLEAHGLSRGRFFIMTHLSVEEMLGNEAPSPSSIAESLGVTRATITQLLDGLERDGFLERRSVGHDRRAQAIYMTKEGHRLYEELVPQTSGKIAEFWAPLNAFERNTLMALLGKLTPDEFAPGGP